MTQNDTKELCKSFIKFSQDKDTDNTIKVKLEDFFSDFKM